MNSEHPNVTTDWLRLNRENWDDRVPIHVASDFYDVDGFRAGKDVLRDYEISEVGDVDGKRLLHLQCHFGLDTLSWARRGAVVTGLDFSTQAIEYARVLADDIGISNARFVAADVYSTEEVLPAEQFDVVYTGIGALVWLPDIPRWARVVAAMLTDGGTFYINEFHPLAVVLDEEDGKTVAHDYFRREPQVFEGGYTYTDSDRPLDDDTVAVEWTHPLGEVVTALADAGLRIEFLRERDATLFQRYSVLERDGAWYRFPDRYPRIPQMYSIRATKTARA